MKNTEDQLEAAFTLLSLHRKPITPENDFDLTTTPADRNAAKTLLSLSSVDTTTAFSSSRPRRTTTPNTPAGPPAPFVPIYLNIDRRTPSPLPPPFIAIERRKAVEKLKEQEKAREKARAKASFKIEVYREENGEELSDFLHRTQSGLGKRKRGNGNGNGNGSPRSEAKKQKQWTADVKTGIKRSGKRAVLDAGPLESGGGVVQSMPVDGDGLWDDTTMTTNGNGIRNGNETTTTTNTHGNGNGTTTANTNRNGNRTTTATRTTNENGNGDRNRNRTNRSQATQRAMEGAVNGLRSRKRAPLHEGLKEEKVRKRG